MHITALVGGGEGAGGGGGGWRGGGAYRTIQEAADRCRKQASGAVDTKQMLFPLPSAATFTSPCENKGPSFDPCSAAASGPLGGERAKRPN